MNFQYRNVSIGADPELFLKDKNTNSWIAACGLIGGSKEKPRRLDKKGHAVQEDNVMVEFNIPPCRTEKKFIQSIDFVLDYLRKSLPKYNLVIEAAAEFPKEQLTHPQCLVFGCDPDFNAWKLEINMPPDPRTHIRTCGGHIHVGYENPTDDSQINLIRAMDLFVGVPSVVLDPDKIRKTRYGKAGAFRPKPYGAEYRVVSNYWIKDAQHISWVYQNTHKAIDFLNSGKTMDDKLCDDVQQCINAGDVDLATRISREFNTLQGI